MKRKVVPTTDNLPYRLNFLQIFRKTFADFPQNFCAALYTSVRYLGCDTQDWTLFFKTKNIFLKNIYQNWIGPRGVLRGDIYVIGSTNAGKSFEKKFFFIKN